MCSPQQLIVEEILRELPEPLAKRIADPLRQYVAAVPTDDGVVAIEVGLTSGDFFEKSTWPLADFKDGVVQVIPVVAANDPASQEDDERMNRLLSAAISMHAGYPHSPISYRIGVAAHMSSGNPRDVFNNMVPKETRHIREIPTRG